MPWTLWIFLLYHPKFFPFRSYQIFQVLRTNSLPEIMKTFVTFCLFEQFRVFSISEESSIDIRENGPSLGAAWGGSGIDATSHRPGGDSREQESGSRVDVYWLSAETAHDSLSEREVSSIQTLWGMSFFRWDFSPARMSIFGIQHFLISPGWYENEPSPLFDLHSPLNELTVRGSLQLASAVISGYFLFPPSL